VRQFEIGLVLPISQSFVDGSTTRWADIRDLAVRAEEMGFDTVWIPDELLWRAPEATEGGTGWWECVAMTGAVAAATSRVKVGTWILSALHRNPGISAKPRGSRPSSPFADPRRSRWGVGGGAA